MKHATVTFKASNKQGYKVIQKNKVGWAEKHNWPQLYCQITKKEMEKAKMKREKITHVLER